MSVRQHDQQQDTQTLSQNGLWPVWKQQEASERSYSLSDEKLNASYLPDANLCIEEAPTFTTQELSSARLHTDGQIYRPCRGHTLCFAFPLP